MPFGNPKIIFRSEQNLKEQYDYKKRLKELQGGYDKTFKTILEPFVVDSIFKFSSEKLNEGKLRVLDIGCGCGYLTMVVAQKNPNAIVQGIDISYEAIKCAKDNFNLDFFQANVLDINDNNKYDVLIYNMVLHNIQNLEASIKKSYEIVKKDGIVIITIPHPVFWLEDKLKRGKFTLNEPFIYSVEKEYQIPFQISNGTRHKTDLMYRHRCLSTYINIFVRYFKLIRFEENDYNQDGNPTMLSIVLKKK